CAVMLLFGVLSLLIVSVGRAGLYNATNYVPSRYLVLGSLAWAMVVFMIGERWAWNAPLRWTIVSLPALVWFNVVANTIYTDRAYSFLEARDRAVLRFSQYGVDGA